MNDVEVVVAVVVAMPCMGTFSLSQTHMCSRARHESRAAYLSSGSPRPAVRRSTALSYF